MQGITVAELALALNLKPKTIKSRLTRAKIKPIAYAGPTAVYEPKVLEFLQQAPRRGRPPTTADKT